MKEIQILQAKKTLIELQADQTTVELILNNIRLYNNLIKEYKAGNFKNLYLTYQVNVQITKQLNEVKKLQKNTENTSETDSFTQLLNQLSGQKETR